jgi:thiol:disulfide interchange protein DsbA
MEYVMRVLKSLILCASMVFSMMAAAEPQAGREYDLIDPPQPTEVKGKIEVIEFFSYACPHCYHLEAPLSAWLKKLPADVSFRRIPLAGGPNWQPTAKLFYTLEAMGIEDKLHGDVFEAIHGDRSLAPNDEGAFAPWIARKGVDAAKFTSTYNSFAVQSRVLNAQQKLQAYGVSGVPAIVINGRYRLRNESVESYDDLVRLLDTMISKVRAEQGGKPKAAAANSTEKTRK